MLQAVVPEEDPVLQGDLGSPLQHQLRDLLEMPTELVNGRNTYFLPVGRSLGLMSSALKAAK